MGDEPARYEVGTIHDMQAIPLEARPRFLAELPTMLSYMDAVAAINAMSALTGIDIKLQNPIWIDDDKGGLTLNISMPGEPVTT